MPRANRYYLRGNIWHITHRCHKKDYLLKFKKDRVFWMQWLFEAKKRYKIVIRKRKQIIDYSSLSKLLNVELSELQEIQKEKIKEALSMNKLERDGKWTEAIAVGSKDYVESIRKQLNIKAIGRRTRMVNEGYELAEGEIPYKQLFIP